MTSAISFCRFFSHFILLYHSVWQLTNSYSYHSNIEQNGEWYLHLMTFFSPILIHNVSRKTGFNINNSNVTSFSTADPVAFITVTIFSKTPREEFRSQALILFVDDVRCFIIWRVLLTASWMLNLSGVMFAMIPSNYLNH